MPPGTNFGRSARTNPEEHIREARRFFRDSAGPRVVGQEVTALGPRGAPGR
jgi:hypothetical protein